MGLLKDGGRYDPADLAFRLYLVSGSAKVTLTLLWLLTENVMSMQALP